MPSIVYSLNSAQVDFVVPDFKTSSGCSPFAYTAMLASGAPLPSCITFNAGTKTFSVYSTSLADMKTYGITVKGTLSPSGRTGKVTFIVKFANPCYDAVYSTPALADQTYYLGQGPMLINIP
jgi:hypothetical protein